MLLDLWFHHEEETRKARERFEATRNLEQNLLARRVEHGTARFCTERAASGSSEFAATGDSSVRLLGAGSTVGGGVFASAHANGFATWKSSGALHSGGNCAAFGNAFCSFNGAGGSSGARGYSASAGGVAAFSGVRASVRTAVVIAPRAVQNPTDEQLAAVVLNLTTRKQYGTTRALRS